MRESCRPWSGGGGTSRAAPTSAPHFPVGGGGGEWAVPSQRASLPGGGGVLLVARRIPGQPGREWTVVFDDDTDRSDPVARAAAQEKLAGVVAADQPA